MKLITLNTWGGRLVEPLVEFLKKNSEVDVFLFQEIYENSEEIVSAPHPMTDFQSALPNHVGYFRPAEKDGFGLATFVKKSLKVIDEGDVFVYGVKDAIVGKKWWKDVGKNLQFLTLETGDKQYTTFNLHGLWEPTGKSDSTNRLKQSKKIIEFVKKYDKGLILGGDFNLRPDTESIVMIERELGLKNLIKEFNVKSTRTSLYTRSDETYADYLFVSPDLKVLDFRIMPDVVSDHAALSLEFE